MRHADARVIHDRAKAADLSVGDFIVGISAGSQTLLDSQRPIDLVRALIASSAELSTLSRDLRHLTALLSHGSIRAAQEYRERLEAVDADVRTHLKLAATLMADLRPLRLRQGTVAND